MTSNITAERIRIIEYDPSYAGALAEMWNRSNESWGGGTDQRTEDSVRRELEISSHLHLFIAVDGEEVVGFCSFSHYRHDEGALYVPLLNVRPDYHGHKVGRNLILNAVRRTVEAGWPRLDLFTWPGNTKAVPMYKKCGFFWEKSDDYVHLMNFIPTVLQTEALAPYFEKFDWYADSTRELVIEPDGRQERGFDYFDYTWQKGDLFLRASFEKTGRGLTALDTPDYAIFTEMDDHDLVFGSAYKIRYHITNRSASDLAIEINGQNDKNIRFDLEAVRTLAPGETVIVESEFALDPVREEQNAKKTHPVVKSEWVIGGRRAAFRIGVAPKFPLKMKMELPTRELYPGSPAELYLNVENNFTSDAEFALNLPEDECMEWTDRAVRFKVPAKSKASIPVPFILRSYGLYAHDIEVTAVPVGERAVSFNSRLSVLVKGRYGRYGGENGDQWVAVNGAYSLHLNKIDNSMWIEYPGSSHNFWWTYPKLGKPFAEEFSKKQASEVKIYSENESQVLEAIYASEEFPGVEIRTVVKLYANGIAEFHNEICNNSGKALEEPMYALTNFGFFGKRLILPYQGHYVDMGDAYASDPSHWDSAQITENWLFCKEENITCGICWDDSLKLLRPEYTLGLEHHLDLIAAGEVVRTKTTVFALNTFANWSDFRSFARKQRDKVTPVLDDHLAFTIGGGNPFAAGVLQAELRERKMIPLAGSLELFIQSDDGEQRKVADMDLGREKDMRAASCEYMPLPSELQKHSGSAWKVRAVYRGEDRVQKRSGLWLPQTASTIACDIEEGPGGPVYAVSNGVISIAAAPAFGSCVHSLKYGGEEWLDSSYPEAVPRSWWNPWYGGLGVDIPGISGFSRQQEPRTMSWAERTDVHGNTWKGLRITTSIEKQEANRGMTINQHYLMLPGVPVLCILHSATNRSGMALPQFNLSDEQYFKPSPVYSEGWMELPNEGKFILGQVEGNLESKGLLRIGADTRKDMLHTIIRYPTQSASFYVNNQVFNYGVNHQLPIRNGETAWTQPTFILCGEKTLHLEDLHDLLKLTFTNPTDDKEISNADH
ncbi:GNAT family N-acetyltransferase [Paenibacillus terrigena]|uniref:GNAT family N-acetyltransferase n=1 Tax=Paenibacillus terrigena TaxID=369333 RepID=UPI00035EEBDC|nr:GNAT family N-acetyltransferase [Paenibacillus terrigena]